MKYLFILLIYPNIRANHAQQNTIQGQVSDIEWITNSRRLTVSETGARNIAITGSTGNFKLNPRLLSEVILEKKTWGVSFYWLLPHPTDLRVRFIRALLKLSLLECHRKSGRVRGAAALGVRSQRQSLSSSVI